MVDPRSQRFKQFCSGTPLGCHQEFETELLSISAAQGAKFLRNLGRASQDLRLLLRCRRIKRLSSLSNVTVKVRGLIDLMDVKAAHQLLGLGKIQHRIQRHLLGKPLTPTRREERVQATEPPRNRILFRFHCLHRRPRIVLRSNRIKCERQQQFCSKLNRRLTAHELQHQIHRNRIPLPRAIVPLHLHDLALVRKILPNEMHFLMCNTYEVRVREASVMQLVPHFPA